MHSTLQKPTVNGLEFVRNFIAFLNNREERYVAKKMFVNGLNESKDSLFPSFIDDHD
jgi:hypothetical protein